LNFMWLLGKQFYHNPTCHCICCCHYLFIWKSIPMFLPSVGP